MKDVYSYFNHRAHHLADLAEFQHFTGIEPHKLPNPCHTCWLSLHQHIYRLMEQWQALTEYFATVAREEKVIKAEKLYALLSNQHFKLVFYFLNLILPKFTEFNLLFQSTALTLHLLHKKISCFIKSSTIAIYSQHCNKENIDLQTMNMHKQIPMSDLLHLLLRQMF